MLDDVAEEHETEVTVVTSLADAPLERHLANDIVGLAWARSVIVERLPLNEPRSMLKQMPNGNAVEVRAAEVWQIVIDGSIEVEARGRLHRPRIGQSMPVEVFELGPAERALVHQLSILSNDKHGTRNRVL